jgi:hypothetical protein
MVESLDFLSRNPKKEVLLGRGMFVESGRHQQPNSGGADCLNQVGLYE